MIKADPDQYYRFIPYAEAACSRVYPLSIAEGWQSGDIYADSMENPKTVFFWHRCGFAYLSGAVSEAVLTEMTHDICFKSGRRMVLITDDSFTERFLTEKEYSFSDRIEYGFSAGARSGVPQTDLAIKRIDADNIRLITGRIAPSFSWEEERFLKGGFGYSAFDHGKHAGTAFTAAVSSTEADIGVEVDPAYRGLGIASALVNRTCLEILSLGKKPVWAHAVSNTASMRTAVKCGFVPKKINRYSLIKPGQQTGK